MDKLKEVVFHGLGEASMCWSETPKGVFDSDHAKRIGDEIMQAIKDTMPMEDEERMPGPDALPALPPMPNPTFEQLHDPTFEAIWDVIKTWDVNVPEYYQGYCGANGSHVVLILNALKEVVNES